MAGAGLRHDRRRGQKRQDLSGAEPRRPGAALVYCAEDSAPALRERLDAIAREMGIALEQLDLIHAHEQLRLDCDHDCQRLALTLERIRPRLLILDPLTRLHQVNENSAAELTPILSRPAHRDAARRADRPAHRGTARL